MRRGQPRPKLDAIGFMIALADRLDRRDPGRGLEPRRAAASPASPAPAIFLAVWVAAAGFGLVSAAPRAPAQLLVTGRPRRRRPPLGRRGDPPAEPPPPAAATDDGIDRPAGPRLTCVPRTASAARSSWSLSTGSYVVNDTMMKLATDGLPPYEVLVLRGLAAVAWGLPLLLLLGYGRQLPLMFERRVLVRNLCETAAILCYVVALANMPIADATALGQITPLLVILGASLRARRARRRAARWR